MRKTREEILARQAAYLRAWTKRPDVKARRKEQRRKRWDADPRKRELEWEAARKNKEANRKVPLTQERLHALLRYDAETGLFHWLSPKLVSRGPAGHNHRNGYRTISVLGKQYFAHRLAWFYVYGKWPAKFIDHANGEKRDNRIVNLREATPSQNNFNAKRPVTNKLGLKGVSYHTTSKRYRAMIYENHGQVCLGYFASPEEAHAAYAAAAAARDPNFVRLK